MWYITLIIMVLWTWGLTPLWVNIVGTVFAGIALFFKFLKLIIALLKEGD